MYKFSNNQMLDSRFIFIPSPKFIKNIACMKVNFGISESVNVKIVLRLYSKRLNSIINNAFRAPKHDF